MEEEMESETSTAEGTEDISLESLGNAKVGGTEKPKLDGEEVAIADVGLVAKNEEQKSKDGMHTYRPVLLKLSYSNDCFEHYGGMRQFLHEDGWGEPTFWTEGKSAIARLFNVWLEKAGKPGNLVTVKEFLTSLIGMKCVLKTETVSYAGEQYVKNVVDRFL